MAVLPQLAVLQSGSNSSRGPRRGENDEITRLFRITFDVFIFLHSTFWRRPHLKGSLRCNRMQILKGEYFRKKNKAVCFSLLSTPKLKNLFFPLETLKKKENTEEEEEEITSNFFFFGRRPASNPTLYCQAMRAN